MSENLWNGKIVKDSEFKSAIQSRYEDAMFWAKPPLSHYILFEAVKKIQAELLKKDKFYKTLVEDLKKREDITEEEVTASMLGLIDFLSVDQLRTKLKRELGSEHPFELKRPSARAAHFEAWYPLGTLVHVTPNNSPLLGVLGVMEGLLSSNVNILKLARKDSAFAAIFYEELCKQDTTGTIKDYVYVAKISSKEKGYLKKILNLADVISTWGGEESVQSIRELAPKGARIVEWGHKISFSYISQSKKSDKTILQKLAYDICFNEQLACSSPQCVFLEDADFEDLRKFSLLLSQALNEVSPTIKRIAPQGAEMAEITVTKEQVRLKAILGTSELVEAPNKEWRIYIENTPTLNSSPLFRTIWLKPMPKAKLIEHLRPLKVYLQTAGIAADALEIEELTLQLFMSGVQRVRAVGEMTDSYIGEPHDGVYALERYCQRINFQDSNISNLTMMKNKISFENEKSLTPIKNTPIMEKADFQNQKVEDAYSDLFFYSGGSSGEPKLSVFTYADYHRQMELAAEGLYAAGLDPKADRCMNLFYAGSLYGGFVSFFTILEKLEAVHFPMGASTDFSLVGKTIVTNNVDTLLGMPSYLIQLFKENHEAFKKYRGIKKIFFGGEHFSEAQRTFLKREYGVEIIRSAAYGSVDAGPLGYQCEFAIGGVHHLHEKLHELEFVDLESDTSVKDGEIGRLLFTSKVRHGQKIERYAIGDVGKKLSGPCACGRKGVRFELLGRHGDVFRIGTAFLSYQKFQKILIDQFEYEGSIQLHLYPGSGGKKEKVVLKIENNFNVSYASAQTPERLLKIFMGQYSDLNTVVKVDLVLDFEVELVDRSQLTFSASTGKLRSVIDHRN
jgi:phenylacetate-coenzyme A ligase PaaK-like adenylate-forming protein